MGRFRWGGYLDNSVAGGIPSGMAPFEALVKESMEEASITENIVRTHAKAVGSISYFTRSARPSQANQSWSAADLALPSLDRKSDGWLQPEIQYVTSISVSRLCYPIVLGKTATDIW